MDETQQTLCSRIESGMPALVILVGCFSCHTSGDHVRRKQYDSNAV
jgi:hypothetical protein